MIVIYYKDGNNLSTREFGCGDTIPAGTVWIDMYNPSREEELYMEKQLCISIPTREETWKNQALNRFYKEEDVSYMTASVITKIDTPYPKTSAITFILSTYLLTIRYIIPTSFALFAQRIVRQPQCFRSGGEVLEGLLEEMITRIAYNSEQLGDELDRLSHDIFDPNAFDASRKTPSQRMKDVLRKLGTCDDLNSKINESLHSLNRLVTFFKQLHGNTPELETRIQILVNDLKSLNQQTAFMSDKITFQLDATLGMINVEQNMIVKIFSIVAVFFLPPTLVSSIYGMNFADMPELQWQYGYPMALTLILICGLVPYVFFRRKGWL
jgi:magnesium transporter